MVQVFSREFTLPEIDRLSPQEHAHVVRRFRRESDALGRIAVLQMAQVGIVAAGFLVAWWWAERSQGLSPTTIWLIVMGGALGIVGLLGRYTVRMLRRELRIFFHERWPTGRPRFCLHCDYDLRGSAGHTCPECGAMIPDGGKR